MIRIKGIVKTADWVRSKLQQGIHPHEVDSIEKFVCNSLQTIENICREENTFPEHLPPRSRKAYNYLKNIEWRNSISSDRAKKKSTSTISPSQVFRIKNIVKQQKNIQKQIRQVKSGYTDAHLESIREAAIDSIKKIEDICQQNKVTASALNDRSRKAYAWIKFLTDKNNLILHVQAIKKFKPASKLKSTQKQNSKLLVLSY